MPAGTPLRTSRRPASGTPTAVLRPRRFSASSSSGARSGRSSGGAFTGCAPGSIAPGMKTVLFVGAGRHQRRAILRARELGLRVVAVDGDPAAEGARVADVAEPGDFANVE